VRILYIVQRYGEDIVGGSEAACRSFAENLVRAGHDVEILTSTAFDYVTWENHYEPGVSWINGVRVNRLEVRAPRDSGQFDRQSQWLLNGQRRAVAYEQRRWAQLMGPELIGQREWLGDNSKRFDVAIFMTYLYATATFGMPMLAGRIPIIFQPTAHTEPFLRVPMFQYLFRQADAFLFFTPEERGIVRERFRFEPRGRVAGIGIETNPRKTNASEIRHRLGVGDDPYLLYVGRLDPMKGVGELGRFFEHSLTLRKHPNLKLVMAGADVAEFPPHRSIIKAGFLSEEQKHGAIAESLALVQPSYFESFSIVLCEAWVQGRPALVQGKSSVLRGQAERSRGAIPYDGFAQFDESLSFLVENSSLREELGENGQNYVRERYSWPVVLEHVTSAIETAQQRFLKRSYRFIPR
jgi:glycosyltransferase involved in cell wall biosynthesis